MAADLIVDESELSIAKNKLGRYFDFLESCFTEFGTIVDSIPGGGLEDVKITQQLFLLRQAVALEKTLFYSQWGTVSKAVNTQLTEIEAADDFSYPNLSVQDIISVLASFL